MSNIVVIRIKGQIGIKKAVKETLNRLKIRKKYSCVVIKNPNESQMGMIKSLRDFVAYGEISEDVYKKLVEKRKTKIENFFRLHPARGGIKTKFHYPKGVLGNHGAKINELVEKML
jgi:large subunit ribosomal protein L30